MVDKQRAVVSYSIEDVIHMLEHEPLRHDFVSEIMVARIMNRVSIVHLSIERALKFLITDAGGPRQNTHALGSLYQKLLSHDPKSAQFLEETFKAAVRHYRHDPNAARMKYLKTLQGYFNAVGSDTAFQNIRYWELKQSMDDLLFRRVYLWIHMELLHGLREILLATDRLPMGTIANRVERAVKDAMWSPADMAYSEGTPKEQAVHSYNEWLKGFRTWRDALAQAVEKGFGIGDDFMANVTSSAYKALLKATDPAVRYFANTLDVVPSQPRDVIPSVEWLGPEKEQRGLVASPAGTCLGFIERGLDGLWYITPVEAGPAGVSAKAKSQTDARCYLAALLTISSLVTVDGKSRSLRLVREGRSFYTENYDEISGKFKGMVNENVWTHKIVFWDMSHGIDVNAKVRFEVLSWDIPGMVDIVEGEVAKVAQHEVYLSGYELAEYRQGKRHLLDGA